MTLNEFPHYRDGGEQINEDESEHSEPAKSFKDQDNLSHRKDTLLIPDFSHL